MTTATITIRDNGDSIEMEGRLDNPDAINQPPTGALIVSSYIAANIVQITEESGRWFFSQMAADAAANEIKEASNEG